jgi:hypothetical protein
MQPALGSLFQDVLQFYRSTAAKAPRMLPQLLPVDVSNRDEIISEAHFLVMCSDR